MHSLIVVAIVAVIITLLLIFKNKISKPFLEREIKVLAVFFFTLGVLRYFMNDNFIWIINGGTYGDKYYKELDLLQSLLRWGHYLSYVVFPCAVFFKKRIYKNIAIYFCFFVTITELFFFKDTMNYFVTDSHRAIYITPAFRYFEYMIELVIGLLLPLVLRFMLNHKFEYKNKKEWFNYLICLPLMLIVCVPAYLPQSLFGFTSIKMEPLSISNIIWILLIFAIIAILYFIFRFKDYESRYSLLVFLSLLLFLHYNAIYSMDLIASRLPLQLCNLAAYLILVALLIKKQAFFNFILLANVAGAAIALVAVDVSNKLLSFWSIHFYIEHTWVFIIPILAVALKIFDRPSKKAFIHYLIGFSVYFIICSIGGIIFNCFLYDPLSSFFNEVNYFYIFDTTVIGALPFLQFSVKWDVNWGGYTFYPIYMLVIYILFNIFSLLFNYGYKMMMNVGDDHFKLRQIKIKMRKEKNYYELHNKKIPQFDYLQEGGEEC